MKNVVIWDVVAGVSCKNRPNRVLIIAAVPRSLIISP
jgi:hypothetical protein